MDTMCEDETMEYGDDFNPYGYEDTYDSTGIDITSENVTIYQNIKEEPPVECEIEEYQLENDPQNLHHRARRQFSVQWRGGWGLNPSWANDHQIDTSQMMLNTEQLCRVCSRLSKRLVPIFGERGAEMDLAHKIHTHLPILAILERRQRVVVTVNDLMPVNVCEACILKLEICHNLVKVCLEGDMKLRNLMGLPTDMDEPEEIDLEHESYGEVPIEPAMCEEALGSEILSRTVKRRGERKARNANTNNQATSGLNQTAANLTVNGRQPQDYGDITALRVKRGRPRKIDRQMLTEENLTQKDLFDMAFCVYSPKSMIKSPADI
uniref:ZAD domain-containing protein n=1 Tax=Timema monikensis TaxID=170555 RepID=A0A7R9E145_9NEOP|nr:unnamed protein product [Timema monikensis]